MKTGRMLSPEIIPDTVSVQRHELVASLPHNRKVIMVQFSSAATQAKSHARDFPDL